MTRAIGTKYPRVGVEATIIRSAEWVVGFWHVLGNAAYQKWPESQAKAFIVRSRGEQSARINAWGKRMAPALFKNCSRIWKRRSTIAPSACREKSRSQREQLGRHPKRSLLICMRDNDASASRASSISENAFGVGGIQRVVGMSGCRSQEAGTQVNRRVRAR